MISIKNLSVSYGKKEILHNLNLNLKNAEIHGIVGLNGSGKTTLLNTIFGLKRANTGKITFKNETISKKHIAYLETQNFFYSNITALEYLSLFQNPNFDIQAWNKLFELPLNDLIEGFSTGMKKKLAILGILKLDKEILILDEPFNGLDLETARIIRLIIFKLKEQGKTIILTSHILETLTNSCDTISYLKNGKVEFSRTKEDFDTIEKAIFEDLEQEKNQILENLL